MHRIAWVLQVVLGLVFVALGVLHLVTPEGLPSPLAWMEDLPTIAHVVAGLAEIAGGLGLVLPSATRVAPRLTPLAAIGLVAVMVPAAVWHATRGEVRSVVGNLVLAGLLLLVARVRTRVHPVGAEG